MWNLKISKNVAFDDEYLSGSVGLVPRLVDDLVVIVHVMEQRCQISVLAASQDRIIDEDRRWQWTTEESGGSGGGSGGRASGGRWWRHRRRHRRTRWCWCYRWWIGWKHQSALPAIQCQGMLAQHRMNYNRWQLQLIIFNLTVEFSRFILFFKIFLENSC